MHNFEQMHNLRQGSVKYSGVWCDAVRMYSGYNIVFALTRGSLVQTLRCYHLIHSPIIGVKPIRLGLLVN